MHAHLLANNFIIVKVIFMAYEEWSVENYFKLIKIQVAAYWKVGKMSMFLFLLKD